MKIKTTVAITATVIAMYWPMQYLLAFSMEKWPVMASGDQGFSEPVSVTTETDVLRANTATATQTSPSSDEHNLNNLPSSPSSASNPEIIESDGYDNYKNGNLAPNENTPKSYRPPQYDPFSNKYRPNYDYTEVLGPVKDVLDLPPEAVFNFQADHPGLADNDSGTTGTTFTFNGNLSGDHETSQAALEVRFDWEGDGNFDTFFSRTKIAYHQFKTPGIYNVTMEVLDRGGNVSKDSYMIKIVENTPPTAYLEFEPESGTNNTIFFFDTSKSEDSQFLNSQLSYRFDWNGDGRWDTKYENKTGWRHKFDPPGTYDVIMEVKDPEGLTAQARTQVTTYANNLPTASFGIERLNATGYVENLNPGADYKVYYRFDASASGDSETPKNKLLYRWDFKYTGKDDIAFDTNWSANPVLIGPFTIPGKKVIRLQVRDVDGATAEAYAMIELPTV